MATIITINSADLMETLTRTNLNTNFANLNAELATMLPKSGGTMTGNIAMGSNRITGLPAPSANDEPARKVDADGKVALTGNETIAGVKTFSSTPVVPDASFGRLKLAAGRRKMYINGTIKSATSWLQVGDLITSGTLGIPMDGPGCIVGLVLDDDTGQISRETRPYQASGAAGDGRFAAGDRLTINRNTSTGVTFIRINNVSVTTNWTVQSGFGFGGGESLQATIVLEFDD